MNQDLKILKLTRIAYDAAESGDREALENTLDTLFNQHIIEGEENENLWHDWAQLMRSTCVAAQKGDIHA